MASAKKQLKVLENAYKTDSLTRSVLDGVDDKAIRQVLREALQPWYFIYQNVGTWANTLIIAVTTWALVYQLRKAPKVSGWDSAAVWSGLQWAGYATLTYWIIAGAYAWWTDDYKDKLGMVWVMFHEDEDRIKRLVKKMDIDEGRVQKLLSYGTRNALLRKTDALQQQLDIMQERIKNIPKEIDREQKALAAALLAD